MGLGPLEWKIMTEEARWYWLRVLWVSLGGKREKIGEPQEPDEWVRMDREEYEEWQAGIEQSVFSRWERNKRLVRKIRAGYDVTKEPWLTEQAERAQRLADRRRDSYRRQP